MLSAQLALSHAPPAGSAGWERRFVLLQAHLGDSWLWLTLIALTLVGSQWRAPEARSAQQRGAWAIFFVMMAAALTVTIVKQRVQRKRPRTGRLLYGRGADEYSFPSGHAARLAAIAVWLSAVSPGWGRFVWMLALLVGLSRIRLGIHYVGDVAAGYAVGGFTAWLLRRIVRRQDAC